MTDIIKILCPKCLEHEPLWLDLPCEVRKCDGCGFTAHGDAMALLSYRAQLLAARKEIAELKARIEYLVKFRDMADPVIKKLNGDK